MPCSQHRGCDTLFAHELQKSFQPVHLYSLVNVGIDNDLWFCSETHKSLEYFKPKAGSNVLQEDSTIHQISAYNEDIFVKSEALFVQDEWSNNYFHWVCDVLPKLILLKCYFGSDMPPVMLKASLRCENLSFIADSLASLGIKSFFQPHDRRMLINKLYSMHGIASSGNYLSRLMRLTARTFVSLAASVRSGGSEMIYISRGVSGRRIILNEFALRSMISQLGYITITLDSISFDEQVSLFHGCKFLLGVHGAGLTNMMWMKPRSNILEIRRRNDAKNNCYFSLASSLLHRYFYCEADQTFGESLANDECLTIDLPRLREEILFMHSK